MIDIHCHILSGLDDGPTSINSSLEMARQAVARGITHVVATPHHKKGKYENIKRDILIAVKDFNVALEKAEIPLMVLPGQETRVYEQLLEDYQQENILTVADGGKYLFIELPDDHVPQYMNQLIYDLQLVGLVPIIVHPERNAEMIANPYLLYKFVKHGALTQITAGSVTGQFGRERKKFIKQMIEANLVHFIASDAHDNKNRQFQLKEALEVITKRFGREVAFALKQNSELLINGENIVRKPPERMKANTLFGIFKSSVNWRAVW